MRYLIQNSRSRIGRLAEETEGQDLIRYGLIAAPIALGAVAGMGFVAVHINRGFSLVENKPISVI